MSDLLQRRLALLANDIYRPLLAKGLRGIERETLRVDTRGNLAMTPHPFGLGSALTNPQITTDYSESLLEFITPAEPDIATALTELDAIHRFAYTQLGDELLWSESMPCHLPDEDQIPIAWYGNSHIGMLKHVYRRGLALRYGRTMQCIAGIHYNYSLAEGLWQMLQHVEQAPGLAMHFQSESYIAMIRNFHRYSWLLMYLFGASPALSTHFLRGREHQLERLSDDTLYLPYATSLRMSDLGYQNNAQAGLVPPYNTLQEYMKSLSNAVRQPYPPYEEIGAQRDGQWVQINTNVLQIENEFYATIRPKRVIRTGERALEALCARGVQYVEVRCMDVDPFEPLGISLQTSRFLDAFLLYCALNDSPLTNDAEGHQNGENFARTVKEGRRPGLMLKNGEREVSLQAWGLELLDAISATATLLDQQRGDTVHAAALDVQRSKLQSPERTPSAKVLDAIRENGGSFERFALAQSKAHAADFRARPLSENETAFFKDLAKSSHDEQMQMERTQDGNFDQFIGDYRSRTPKQLCE
ncbi:MAG TPA: glutamate--cysteine ligase [Burkholderiaceae bacterium]|nr:glutamate--cysteine ligase [Burkholderiaceae bacterium]